MGIDLKNRSFLTLKDFSKEEILYLLDLAGELKERKKSGIRGRSLQGKNIVLIFEKTSTRTRCSFEVSVYDEGGSVTFLSNSQFGKKESVEDSAKVLGQFYDGIEFRGYSQDTVEQLARFSGVPVWNGLTDMYHPTQILADFLTIGEEVKKPLEDIKFVYAGDARNNMGNSLMIGAAKLGMDFVAFAPKELWPESDLVEEMKAAAEISGGSITLTQDMEDIKGADVIYTDVWVSMGEEDMFEERIELLKAYQVNMDMIKKTENEEVVFLHCLPAFHDTNTDVGMEVYKKFGIESMEVTDEVFRSKHSKVFEEASNRLHTIKAVMVATLGDIR